VDPKETMKDERERKEKYYERIEKIKDANCNSEVYFVSDNDSIAEELVNMFAWGQE
jgi:hypothetical protein